MLPADAAAGSYRLVETLQRPGSGCGTVQTAGPEIVVP
jgi:hypothetical protein